MGSDKLSPEEEVHRLQNGNGGVMLAAAQLRQPGEGSSHEVSEEPQTLESPFLLPHTFFDANGDQLKDRLPDILWDMIEQCAMPFETTPEGSPNWSCSLDWGSLFHIRRSGMAPEEPAAGIPQLPDSPRNQLPSAAIKSSSAFVNFAKFMAKVIPSATKTSCTSSRSAHSTISTQRQRWSLKCLHACGHKEKAEDEDMDTEAEVMAHNAKRQQPGGKCKL